MRDEAKKKRVLRACDTCRVKKAKCDGGKPCGRCQTDDQVCTYAHRRKHSERVFTNDYVGLLESKLQTVLKSFMFLINEMGEGRDCSRYVAGPDNSISHVIELLSDEVKNIDDTSDMDEQVQQLLESSKLLANEHHTDTHSDEDRATPVAAPRPRRGRPPKAHTASVYSSPISRPTATATLTATPTHLPSTPRIKEETPVYLKDEELDTTKNSLMMNWQNPQSNYGYTASTYNGAAGSGYDAYRSNSISSGGAGAFDDYALQESQFAENLVFNDELLSVTPPGQDQVPEFGHPAEYDLPMEDINNPYQYCPELTRSISVEM